MTMADEKNLVPEDNQGDIVIYQTEDGATKMSDYVVHLDRVLSSTGEQLLVGAGKVSHKQAIEKANREYQRFVVQNLSPVEEAYLQTIKEVEKTAKKKAEVE